MSFKHLLAFCLWLSAAMPAIAAFGIKSDGHLDMARLRKAYMESDFEEVRASLEGYLKRQPKTATREEKIFAHLYLGVICAADSNSEVKAESHFNALLRISPHIEPVDMFVPPKIQDLFDRIKRDFLKREEYGKRYDSFGNPIAPEHDSAVVVAAPAGKDPQPIGKDPDTRHPAVDEGKSHAWVWWTVGSAAVVAAGVGIYALAASEEKPAPHITEADGSDLK